MARLALAHQSPHQGTKLSAPSSAAIGQPQSTPQASARFEPSPCWNHSIVLCLEYVGLPSSSFTLSSIRLFRVGWPRPFCMLLCSLGQLYWRHLAEYLGFHGSTNINTAPHPVSPQPFLNHSAAYFKSRLIFQSRYVYPTAAVVLVAERIYYAEIRKLYFCEQQNFHQASASLVLCYMD